ncbi:hypothetical protein NFJ02_38g95260 [Pycnococcus provasolii]
MLSFFGQRRSARAPSSSKDDDPCSDRDAENATKNGLNDSEILYTPLLSGGIEHATWYRDVPWALLVALAATALAVYRALLVAVAVANAEIVRAKETEEQTTSTEPASNNNAAGDDGTRLAECNRSIAQRWTQLRNAATECTSACKALYQYISNLLNVAFAVVLDSPVGPAVRRMQDGIKPHISTVTSHACTAVTKVVNATTQAGERVVPTVRKAVTPVLSLLAEGIDATSPTFAASAALVVRICRDVAARWMAVETKLPPLARAGGSVRNTWRTWRVRMGDTAPAAAVIVLLFAYGVTDAALDIAAGHSQYNYSPVYSYSHSAAAQERSSSSHVSAADLHKHMKKMDETKKHMDAKLAEIAKHSAAAERSRTHVERLHDRTKTIARSAMRTSGGTAHVGVRGLRGSTGSGSSRKMMFSYHGHEGLYSRGFVRHAVQNHDY